MALDNLKVPREALSIKDQIPVSIFRYESPKKYTVEMSGITIGSDATLKGRRSSVVPAVDVQENDYIENTYIDDYFQ